MDSEGGQTQYETTWNLGMTVNERPYATYLGRYWLALAPGLFKTVNHTFLRNGRSARLWPTLATGGIAFLWSLGPVIR
jgi:hypothetical protein